MGNKRTRERQLAKQAAQRRAARDRQHRKRTAAILGGIGAGLLAVVIGILVFTSLGDDTAPAAGPTPTSVTPVVEAPKKVACGGEVPPSAGEPKPLFAEPPQMRIDPTKAYSATMTTSCGTIQLDLLAEGAPVTVNNFVFLSEQGFYDGLRFTRVLPGFVIQGGDPTGSGGGDAGYEFQNEVPPGEAFDGPGILAMANAGPNTNGSQFFITLGSSPSLTPEGYTIFGRVTRGQDVVDEIAKVPLDGETPREAVYIDRVTIRES